VTLNLSLKLGNGTLVREIALCEPYVRNECRKILSISRFLKTLNLSGFTLLCSFSFSCTKLKPWMGNKLFVAYLSPKGYTERKDSRNFCYLFRGILIGINITLGSKTSLVVPNCAVL
jgi:hypothetical protein